MAQTKLYQNRIFQDIPLDGVYYFTLGPFNFQGAVNVTAQAISGIELPVGYMEVIQMATRSVSLDRPGEPQFILDIVVRNNAHVGGTVGGTISEFDVWTSVVSN